MSTEILEQKQSEITVIANNINSGLAAFEKRKSELIALKDECEGLDIKSIEDKQAITQVSTYRKKLKSARVEIEKEGKLMRDPLTQMNKSISEKEKELIAIIEPTEKDLLAKEKWVEDQKEMIRLEEERKEQERIQNRINRLAVYGFSIDLVLLKGISDEQFEETVESAKKEYEKEQAAKAEAERLAKLEQERINAEREELEKLRAERDKAQAIIDAENERIRKEQQEKEDAIRLEQEKIEAEKMRIAREQEIKKAQEEAAEKARLQAIEDAKEADRLAKLEEERKSALRPDKEKLESFAQKLGSIIDFQVKQPEAQEIVNEIVSMVGKMQTHIIKRIKSL